MAGLVLHESIVVPITGGNMNTKSIGSKKVFVGKLALGAILGLLGGAVAPAHAQVTILCPPDQVVTNDAGVCSAVVQYPAPEVIGAGTNTTVTCTPPSGAEFPGGDTEVLCTVTDETETELASCGFLVTVEDSEAPSIEGETASQSVLWPPNHKMVHIGVVYDAADNCDEAPVCSLSVTSNEALNGHGDGNTDTDWEVLDEHHVRLRAERSGCGNGRIYTITINCADSSGNEASDSVTVSVPHSRGKGHGKGHGTGDKNK
jgi:hypothetical protein